MSRWTIGPLTGADGTRTPAWYAASTRDGAIFESVFHDIRPSHAKPSVFPNQYVDRILAPVATVREVLMVDLTTVGLHAIGITRRALIESTSRRYAWTASIAQRLHDLAPGAEGFFWT